MAGLRLGSVPYLNAEPLIRPLETGVIEHPHKITKAVPSELASKLVNGEIDCAIAPVVAVLENPRLVPLPDVAIVSRGAAASVLLFHNDPLGELETIWLDPASRTSNLLVQILRDKASADPCEFILPTEDEVPPILDLPKKHGRLIIGDSALAYGSEKDIPVDFSDLGALWRESTGHPFTYARWIARTGDIAAELTPLVREARDWSLIHLHELIDPLAEQHNFPAELVDRYLRQNITYMYGPREQAGGREFFSLAGKIIQTVNPYPDA